MRQYAIKSFLKDIKQSFVTTSCETNNFSIHTVNTTRITPFSAYVCTELIFDSQLFLCIKIFLKIVLRKLAVHIFTFLLAPFTSKLVNYSRHSETLNFRKNSKSTTFSFENSDLSIFQLFSKTHCASNNWPIWT